MKKLAVFFREHAMLFVIGAIAVVSLILVIIIFTLASSGDSRRKIVIDDIAGSAFILKTDGQIPADRNMKLGSGDVIITSSDGSVKLSVDKDKYIYIEPDTTVYINYTDSSERGSIVVNISQGAAVARLDSKLPKNTAFEVRTPNAVVSAAGTVFRTEFTYLDTYGGYDEVKLTEVQCADGEVNIQLYDNDAAPADQLMMLAECKSARLMTCADISRYEYLNNPTDIFSLSEATLKNLIRIAAEREIGYTLSTLNAAYQQLISSSGLETTISTMYPVTEETEAFSTANVTVPEVTAVTTVPEATSETTPTETATVTTETETLSETAVISEAADTTASETVSTAISVTSPTTKVYNVTTTAQPSETTVTTAPETTTAAATETIPPIKPAETVTTTTTAAETTTENTTEKETTSKTTVSTIPWWEIVNSGALN